MDKEILEVLKSIDSQLCNLISLLTESKDEPIEELKIEEDEEEQIINFLKGLTEELGLKDHVVIRKVTIK